MLAPGAHPLCKGLNIRASCLDLQPELMVSHLHPSLWLGWGCELVVVRDIAKDRTGDFLIVTSKPFQRIQDHIQQPATVHYILGNLLMLDEMVMYACNLGT